MLGTMEVIGWIVVLSLFAFYRVPIIAWTLITAALLIGETFYSALSGWTVGIFWIVFLYVALMANCGYLRQRIFTQRIFQYVQKQLPPMSVTERVALDAGDVWWEGELFCGNPDWKKLLSIPAPKLTPEEQAFIDNQVNTLCSMANEWEINAVEKDLPKRVWDYLKKERFLGMVIPKEYGGLGFSALLHSTVITKLASRSVTTAVSAMVPNSLGPGELLERYGTPEQKKYYLPRLAVGEEIPCFGLTAPDAGSDAASIPDFGIVCRGKHDGKEVLGLKLTWDKRYITLAPIATLLGLAVHVYDPEKLLGGEEYIGIAACLIPTNHPGVEIGHKHAPMNLFFMNGPTRGKDVFIPLDWIIGGAPMIDQGWRMLMECLSIGRSISLPALATATSQLCYRTTGAYSKVRQQFHASIASFEGVAEGLANIAGYTYLLESTRVMTAHAVSLGINPSIVSAIAKYHMTETGRRVLNDAMDIHGGRAIQLGPRNYLGFHYISIPISITVEGANILTRNLIIFGQGAMRCHPYIRQEMEAVSDPNQEEGLKKLDRLLLSHVGYLMSNKVRAFWYGLTNGRFNRTPESGFVAPFYRQLTRMSAALAYISDVTLLMLGGKLKRKERLSSRLGDVLSQLYLASSVLKYFSDQGSLEEDKPYVKWCVEMCLFEVQKAFEDFFAHFPNKIIGKLLCWVIFPLGKRYRRPSEANEKALLKSMLEPSSLRDRLTKYCYIGQESNDPIGRLDHALVKMLETVEFAKILDKAVKHEEIPEYFSHDEKLKCAVEKKILKKEEADALREFETLRVDAIKVDEF